MIFRLDERRRQTDEADGDQQGRHQPPGKAARVFVQAVFGLPDEPGGAEQGVADDEADAGQQAEGRQPFPPAAGIGAALDGDTLDQGAQWYTLSERVVEGERERVVWGKERSVS